MKIRKIIQGDVVLTQIAKLPTGTVKAVKPENGRFILARGEVTGHNHAVVADPAEVELVEINGTLYIKASKDETLVHEEHKAVEIPGNTLFEVKIVKEYDHFAEEARQVKD